MLLRNTDYEKLLLMTNHRLSQAIDLAYKLNPDLFVECTRRLRKKFNQHRVNARNRGIEFNLTWPQWRAWWLDSGHVDERGRQRGQWVMGRIGDRGAYELGNIECVLAESNVTLGNVTRRYPGEYST